MHRLPRKGPPRPPPGPVPPPPTSELRGYLAHEVGFLQRQVTKQQGKLLFSLNKFGFKLFFITEKVKILQDYLTSAILARRDLTILIHLENEEKRESRYLSDLQNDLQRIKADLAGLSARNSAPGPREVRPS